MRIAGIEGAPADQTGAHHPARPGARRGTRIWCNRDFQADGPEPAVGHRPDLRADLGRGRLRVLHRRRVLQDDRRLAGRLAHAHQHGPRRDRDGPLVTRHPPRRAAVSLRCRRRSSRRVRYGERLAEIGAVPSIGTVGDSFDNALAETVNGYYKTELDPRARPAGSRGRPSRTSSWPPSAGCTGTTPAPARLPRRRPAGRVRADVLRCAPEPTRPRSESHSAGLHQTQGGSGTGLDDVWLRLRTLPRFGVAHGGIARSVRNCARSSQILSRSLVSSSLRSFMGSSPQRAW